MTLYSNSNNDSIISGSDFVDYFILVSAQQAEDRKLFNQLTNRLIWCDLSRWSKDVDMGSRR